MSPDLAASRRSWFTPSMSTKGSPAGPASPTAPVSRPATLMRQTILLPDPCCSIRHSQGVVLAAQSRSRRASCSDRRLCAQKSVPSALTARLPLNAPPNPTVALLAEYRGCRSLGLPNARVSRVSMQMSNAASRSRRSARETSSDQKRLVASCDARDAVLTERR
jgi:hypothetical protein